jgi:hypothetical protein
MDCGTISIAMRAYPVIIVIGHADKYIHVAWKSILKLVKLCSFDREKLYILSSYIYEDN